MPLKLDNYDLSEYVIVLTGATDGIGKEMARILAGFNPKRLILPVRNMEKGNDLLKYVEASNRHANNVEIWEMDLADLQSVKNFANKFINEVGKLHMLFNNAGTWTEDIFKTIDNLELQFQVNHLAPFLLTNMLLDTMKKSVSTELPGKIVFTSSSAQKLGEIDFDNLNLEKGPYSRFLKSGYANTKLMNVIISKELSRILKGENIQTYSIHPGFIQSNICHTSNSSKSYRIKVAMKIFGGTSEQGAINVLYPVLNPENKESGKYYGKGNERNPSKLVEDQELAKKFWNVSEQILEDRHFYFK